MSSRLQVRSKLAPFESRLADALAEGPGVFPGDPEVSGLGFRV